MEGQERRSAWTFQQLVALITSIPEVEEWADFRSLLSRAPAPGSKPSWEYVCHACQALGREWQTGLPGAAAILCLHYSIHLVDDLLDEDPKGLQHRLGVGPTGNLATALQAVAGVCLGRHGGAAPAVRIAMHEELHRAVLTTGYGQYLDAVGGEGEEHYWKVAGLKTPPLFRCALVLGALAAGASVETAREVGDLGSLLGEIAQINDDLGDALERPAKPDWQRPDGCLPILFARVAEHPERRRFDDLLERLSVHPEDEKALAAAQEILLRSGAVSYCAYRLAEAYRQGVAQVGRLAVAHGEHLVELLDFQILPLRRLFERHGIDDLETLGGGA